MEQSIPGRWAELVARQARRPAVFAGDWRPTYGELDAAANRCAHALHAHGGQTGDRVAVLLRHEASLPAAILAVLKAGCVVVVLNPSDPPARMHQVLADAAPALLVTDAASCQLAQQLAGAERKVVCWDEIPAGPETAPAISIPSDAPAWLLYTSGTTGKPKGVIQTHRNILHNARRLGRGMEITAADRIALLASPSGGQGLATIWCAWAHGAALGLFPVMEWGVTGLDAWLREYQVTILVASASLFRNFLRTLEPVARFPSVRLVRLASEPANTDDFAGFRQHFAPGCILFSSLSSSETGNVLQQRIAWNESLPAGRLPVGHAAEGIEILLLDAAGQAVAAGEIGELVIRSRYLSPGYWRNEALTAERFSAAEGTDSLRCYRSGDLARRTPTGEIEFQGRKDAQAKIRGYRIETAEVEAELLRQPEVAQATVVVQTAGEDAQLLAFVVPRTSQCGDAERLRQALRESLPTSMMPHHFIFLEALPLTPHGKVDRAQLVAWKHSEPAAVAEVLATETEIALAEIWRTALRVPHVGRQSDFIQLGGDSLKAIVVAAKVHAAFGVELDLRRLTQHSQLGELAGSIDELRRGAPTEKFSGLERVPRDGPLPLSFSQLPVWKESQTPAGAAGYTITSSHRIVGRLDVAALRSSLEHLARRHEILRVTFAESEGQPVHVVHPPGHVDLPVHDFSTQPDPAAAATEFFRQQARTVFDLRRGPLMNFYLARIGAEEHWLCRINHHIISDAWSWQVFFRELAQVYGAKLHAAAPPVSDSAPLQYFDYAAWQRRVLDPNDPAYLEAVRWWAELWQDRPQPVRLPFQRLWRRREALASDGWVWWGIDPEVSGRLDEFGRSTGATFYVVRLAAFIASLASESGESDLVIGSYMTNRHRLETQNMFGFFGNMAALRWRFDGTQTFRAWTANVNRLVGDARARSFVPHEQLRSELRARGLKPPKMRIIFSVTDTVPPLKLGEAELTWLDRRMEAMPWGFTLGFDPSDEAHRCRATFDARWFDPNGVRQWLGRFACWLDAVSREPDKPMSALIAESEFRPRLSFIRRLQRRLGI